MENLIRHDGIIESVDGRHVQVRIVQTSACAGCKVAAHCHTAEAKEKIIDVVDAEGQWQAGQTVVVTASSTMAGKALLIGFGLPLLLMLAVLAVLKAAGCSEGMTALLMLGVLIPYYLSVWMLRNRIAQDISFRLEETNS
ncbi:MAG: SoxR reducing system RseC family protein [Prevotella sp.]